MSDSVVSCARVRRERNETPVRVKRVEPISDRHKCPRTHAPTPRQPRPLPRIGKIQHSSTGQGATGLLPHPPTQHPPPSSGLAAFALPHVERLLPPDSPADPSAASMSRQRPNNHQRHLAGGQPVPLPHGFATGSVRIAAAEVSRGLDGPLGLAYMSPRGASTARTPPPVRSLAAPSLLPRPRAVGAGWRRLFALCRARPALLALRARSAPPLNPPPALVA